jgi:hypothetical protein
VSNNTMALINCLTNCAQIIDRAKQEWQSDGAWSEWDQSVRDDITKNLKLLYGPGRIVPHHGSGPDNQ